ncbi:MAG: UDP-N-acetylglucosamine 2-epimerase [Herbinix sp.]|jgi:UDP-N-acetylglucosamine 2-epimerase (non-hydrolysing)|nr:UDP-N-acetylglucosamine 2-epimerase [Herbinix sp.]
MKKLRVMTVVGTRPEIIRLSSVIKRLEESDAVEHVLVHTGQNYDYELNDIFFQDLKLKKADYYLSAVGSSAVETIGNILIQIDPVLAEVRPDAFLILGDTNSCLSAIAAKRRHIPIFHMEAGNRCFDQRVPEETNRKIVDHISDINLTYSSLSKDYLIKEGFPADRIINTGSPMFEVINLRKDDIGKSEVLSQLSLMPGQYFVVSAHREENVDSEVHLQLLIESLNAVAEKYQLSMIFSTHPRTRHRLLESKRKLHPLIQILKPFGYHDFLQLQKNAKAVISDSGTISEEAAILGIKALNIRQAHERPEAMEETAVMMTGLTKDRILQGLSVLETQSNDKLRCPKEYLMPNVSEKVLRIILSYTDYVNQVVWRK